MSDSEELSSHPKLKASIAQKIGIFFLMPIFIVIAGFIIYDKQLADPTVIAVTGFVIFIIFLATGYLIVRKMVKKQYDSYLKMQLITITDELTQLYTKKHFNDLLGNELARAMRYERMLCCGIIEIDGYKEIKEKYGDQFGDELLQDTAESLKDDLRMIDIMARDDDKFIYLFPETDVEPALFVSKRLRSVIEGDTFDTGGDDGAINITISIGMTSSNPAVDDEIDIHKIMGIAEKALTIAKEQGGNTIEYLAHNSAQPT